MATAGNNAAASPPEKSAAQTSSAGTDARSARDAHRPSGRRARAPIGGLARDGRQPRATSSPSVGPAWRRSSGGWTRRRSRGRDVVGFVRGSVATRPDRSSAAATAAAAAAHVLSQRSTRSPRAAAESEPSAAAAAAAAARVTSSAAAEASEAAETTSEWRSRSSSGGARAALADSAAQTDPPPAPEPRRQFRAASSSPKLAREIAGVEIAHGAGNLGRIPRPRILPSPEPEPAFPPDHPAWLRDSRRAAAVAALIAEDDANPARSPRRARESAHVRD